jgi:hypothetical protein
LPVLLRIPPNRELFDDASNLTGMEIKRVGEFSGAVNRIETAVAHGRWERAIQVKAKDLAHERTEEPSREIAELAGRGMAAKRTLKVFERAAAERSPFRSDGFSERSPKREGGHFSEGSRFREAVEIDAGEIGDADHELERRIISLRLEPKMSEVTQKIVSAGSGRQTSKQPKTSNERRIGAELPESPLRREAGGRRDRWGIDVLLAEHPDHTLPAC